MQKISFVLFVLASTALADLDVLSYHLRGHFNWEKKQLEATVRIDFNSTEASLNLDSKVTRVSQVTDQKGQQLKFTYASPKLEIQLPAAGRNLIEIAYEVEKNGALHVVPHRKGDPIEGRVAFTLSEPVSAKEWMPCHDIPADRAYFSTEFALPKQEMLISNGDLTLDTVAGDVRLMNYRTSYTIPTYLMAFALGDFVSVSHAHQKTPVRVYARPGLPVDYEGVLKNIIEQMATYERLLGIPYPFEKYALVILPEHQSGMEHAGITFQGEIKSTQGLIGHDYSLTAHELAHQWFGDLVTIKEWDDLWIKEGMATLMAEEAQRRFEDKNKSGRLFGLNFTVNEGEAIRDPELAPDDKYTEGPYGRSAWLLTQIRSIIGEKSFWGTLHEMLTRYRFEAIGTDEFLALFPLSPEQLAKAHEALAAKKLPSWSDAALAKLEDPEGSLLTPLVPHWKLADGKISETPTLDSFLIADPTDLHPLTHFKGEVAQLIPPSASHLPGLLDLGAQVSLLAMDLEETSWPLTTDSFLSFWNKLPSEQAKFSGLRLACRIFAEKGESHWEQVVEQAMAVPPLLGFPDYDPEEALSGCGKALPERIFASQWKEMETHPTSSLLNETELILLANFATSPELAFNTWGNLALNGATVRAKRLGVLQLSKHYQSIGKYAPPTEAERPTWTAFFQNIVDTVEVDEIKAIAQKAIKPPTWKHEKRMPY